MVVVVVAVVVAGVDVDVVVSWVVVVDGGVVGTSSIGASDVDIESSFIMSSCSVSVNRDDVLFVLVGDTRVGDSSTGWNVGTSSDGGVDAFKVVAGLCVVVSVADGELEVSMNK